MAVLIPDVPKNCTNSERYVYERLGRELPDDCVVLHSLGLSGHEKKIWGEADIVVLSEQGVFALEVKGGAVNCVDGIWTYSGDFETFTKAESPWAQAMGALAAVRNQLRKHRMYFGEVLFGFGVVMPYTTFTATGPEIVAEVLLDQRTFKQPLKQYIKLLERYWKAEYQKKHKRLFRGLSRREIHEARQILRPDLETALNLGGYLTGLDDHLVQLTNEQILASRRMAANPRTIVRGSAGTGKSIIAFERVRQLSEAGSRVLYLCFNKLLASHVRNGLSGNKNSGLIQVYHAHELYRKLIEEAGFLHRLLKEGEDQADFFSKRFPEIVIEALCEKSHSSWDAIVVDEAQDLLTPEHLDVLDLLLIDGLSRGRWHLFLDPLQNIYSDSIQSTVTDRLLSYAPTFDDLYVNCRNTRQVAIQTSIVSNIELTVTGAPDGPESALHYYSNKSEALNILENLIQHLVDSQVCIEDIAILSTRQQSKSLVSGCLNIGRYRLVNPVEENLVRNEGLMISTMHAFKGLDRQTVIAIDMHEIGDEYWSMLHYTGLSRARVLLHILLPMIKKSEYERLAREFGRKLINKST